MTPLTIALYVYMLAQAADVITTLKALSMGKQEANPVLDYFVQRCGKCWVVAKLALTVPAAVALYWYGSTIGLLIVAAVTGYVAHLNWKVIKGR